MKLMGLLEPGRIIHRLEATTKKEALVELVHRGFVQKENNTELGIADADRIVRVLEERERMGSTGIKDGLAIPHGKIERLDQLVACLALSETGIDFRAMDNKDSRVFIVLLAPETGAGAHLKALARVSRVFSEPTLTDRLMECPDVEHIWATLAAEDERYG
jgi:nitrogen PTS system EIIA component